MKSFFDKFKRKSRLVSEISTTGFSMRAESIPSYELDRFLKDIEFTPREDDGSEYLLVRLLRPANYAISKTFKCPSDVLTEDENFELQKAIIKSDYYTQLPRYGPYKKFDDVDHRPLTKEERHQVTLTALEILSPSKFLMLESNGVKAFKNSLDAEIES